MITCNRVMIKAPKGAHSFLREKERESKRERIKKEMKEKKR